MSKISTNPLDDMNNDKLSVQEKLQLAGMEGAVSMGPWVTTIIDNSSEVVTKGIVNIHLDICRLTITGLGYMIEDTTLEYQSAFKKLMDSSPVLNFDTENLVVTLDEQKLRAINEAQKIKENQSNYHTVNNLGRLVFNREPRQYRRVRRKITFIHDKVLVTPILAEQEKTTVPFVIRESANSNPDNDKKLTITNVVYNTIVALSELSSTSTKERNSVFLRSVYRDLLTDIEEKPAPVYKFDDLVAFFAKVKEKTYKEYEQYMRNIYDRLGAKAPKRIGFKNSPSVVGKDVHEYLMSEAPDAVHTRELIEHYNLIDIVG